MAVCAMLITIGCGGKPSGACHITGTVDDPELNGKRIFLVPLTDTRREVVDSVVIEDGKFEFYRDTLMMAKILMDYHYRMNTQTLLVVAEPGEGSVRIGTVSSAQGTPQNDSLQTWKEVTEKHNQQTLAIRNEIQEAKAKGDEAVAARLKQQYDSIHLVYKNYSRRMAANMEHTVLGDFLAQQFPTTYNRQYPDGMVVRFDADTRQPLDTIEPARQ